MKDDKKQLLIKLLKQYKTSRLTQGHQYYRFSKKVIGNELYIVKRNFDSFYGTVNAGNDVDMEALKRIQSQIQNLVKVAKKFQPGDQVPKQYLD